MSTPIFQVERPGLLTTVQDAGRAGGQRDGMPVGGWMDPWAGQAANILCGNRRGEAVLEITLAGPTLRALESVRIAVGGADLSARIDGEPLPSWHTAHLRPGQTLTFGRRRAGARAYLAVAGGLDVPRVGGSRATFLPAQIGGLEGRALRAGDVLRGTPAEERLPGRALASSVTPDYDAPCLARVVLGPHGETFDPAQIADFLGGEYAVTPQSDRMGFRLDGPALVPTAGGILSEPMPLGGIQIPPEGRPILLMADRQTVGGYPLLGVVIAADLPHVAQLAPGDVLSFQAISVEEAQELAIRQERLLRLLEWAARQGYPHSSLA